MKRSGLAYLTFVLLAALALSLANIACGGDSSGNGDSEEAAEEVVGEPIDTALPQIKLLKPGATGAGEVPRFEWQSFEGAATYRLVLLDANRKPVWAWQGAETSVNLGGLPNERPADISGPIITSGSVWSVSALDAQGNPVAVSVLRPVSP